MLRRRARLAALALLLAAPAAAGGADESATPTFRAPAPAPRSVVLPPRGRSSARAAKDGSRTVRPARDRGDRPLLRGAAPLPRLPAREGVRARLRRRARRLRARGRSLSSRSTATRAPRPRASSRRAAPSSLSRTPTARRAARAASIRSTGARSTPGPFYVVWTGPGRNDAHRYPWPYQLARIEIGRASRTASRTPRRAGSPNPDRRRGTATRS